MPDSLTTNPPAADAARVNLFETLAKDAETIADSDLPSVSDVTKFVGALIKRIEAQAQQDGLALLAGDPDPVVDPADQVTPIAPDGAPAATPPVAAAASPPPVLPVAATTDGSTVSDHTATSPPVTDLSADVAELKGTVAGLVDAVKHLFTPSAPTVVTTEPVTDTAEASIPDPQHDLAGNPIEPAAPDVSVQTPAPS
jgi:hypothetical protein